MGRFKLLLLAIAFLTLFVRVGEAATCGDVFRAHISYDSQAQQNILNEIDIGTLRIVDSERLSWGNPVYKIRDESGRVFVVRFAEQLTNLPFEKFATTFLNEVPGLKTPTVRYIPEGVAPHVARAVNHLIQGKSDAFSISFYLPLKNGESYFKELGAKDGVRFPHRSKIPQGIKTQLANYWVVYTVLNIPDFHLKNWLVTEGEKVIGIDMAIYFRDLSGPHGENAAAYELPIQQSPFSFNPITSDTIDSLIEGASPEVINYLKGLTVSKIQLIARKSGQEISAEDIAAFMRTCDAIILRRQELEQNK